MIDYIFQINKEKETADFGRFSIEPLERGYGHTLGNALRRVLLSSLSGSAITQVKIAGVKHQFSTLEGLKEDTIDFILNLKQVRIEYRGEKPVKLTLEETGPKEIKAGDIKTPAGVRIVNQDHVLGSLADKKSRLKVEMVVETGFGYSPAEERKSDRIGVISVDAAFSPVRRVNYWVEATRVGRKTDLDRLIIEINTDGTIKPSDVLKKASQILLAYFNQLVSPKKTPKVDEEEKVPSSVLPDLTVEELDLPTRIANALRKGGYGTLKDLANAHKEDLAKVKNLGEKSVKVVEAALAEKGSGLSLKEN